MHLYSICIVVNSFKSAKKWFVIGVASATKLTISGGFFHFLPKFTLFSVFSISKLFHSGVSAAYGMLILNNNHFN